MLLVRAFARRPSSALLGYASVHFGKSLLWAGEDALALYVMIRFLGLDPALAGLLFLASALWNAMCDGLVGAALDRWPGLARSMPALVIPAIAASCLGFAALPSLGQGDVPAVVVLLLLFRTGFCLIDIPHNGLTRHLADAHGHLAVARIRALGAGSAAVMVGLASFMVLAAGDGARATVEGLARLLAAAALLFMLPLPLLLRQDAADDAGRTAGRGDFGGRPFWIYCLASIIGLAGLAATGKAILHVDFSATGIGAAVFLLLTAGRLGAILLWSPVARRFGNRTGLALAYGLSGCSALAIPGFAGVGGPGPLLLLALAGLSGGGVAFLGWAVLSETIGAGRPGRSAGAYAAAFGFFTMSMKVGLGLSAMIVGAWLSGEDRAAAIDPALFWPLGATVLFACAIAAALILWPGAARPASPAFSRRGDKGYGGTRGRLSGR